MMPTILLLVSLSFATAQEWTLYWSDEFDGDEIDLTNWQHEVTMWGGGNGEFQTYQQGAENSFVQDGYLFIQPTLLRDNIDPLTGEPYGDDFIYNGTMDLTERYGVCTNIENNGCVREGKGDFTEIPPIGSARLRSYERFSFRYGRVEVRANLPVGDWLWPAIWYLPENWCYGVWPISGEMDLVETVGNEDFRWPDGAPAGMQHMGCTLHWGPAPDLNRYYLTSSGKDNETSDFGRNWHIYSMEWEQNNLTFFVDDELVLNLPNGVTDEDYEWNGFFEFGDFDDSVENPWTVSNDPLAVPFDTNFHILMNVAVGGTNGFISDDAINRGGDPQYAKPWVNGLSQVEGMNAFYEAEDAWHWTWTKEGDNNAMRVDYVRVYKRDDLPPEADPDCPVRN